MQIYNNRSEVPEKYKWDLTEFCKDEKEFLSKYKKIEELIQEIPKYQGCVGDAHKLKEFLDLMENALGMLEEIYVYAHLINDQELGNSFNEERFLSVLNLETKLNTSTCFFAPELLKLSKSEFASLFGSDKSLELYRFQLESIYREKKYVLSDKEERIISDLEGAGINYSSLSSVLLNALHDYGEVTLSDGTKETLSTTNYGKIMKNSSSKKREQIYNSLFKVVDQYASVNASLLDGFVKKTNTIAKLHNFKNAWEAKLFELNLSNKVFTSLIEACENNLESLQRFYRLKASCLGVSVLHSYDLPLDLVKNGCEYSVEEAQELITKALKPLGDDYIKKLRRIFDERFIDYAQYKGKQSGGYSISIRNHTSRILMSYNGDLDSVSTIAHEAGHNVNHQYICENNPSVYSDTRLIVAEVASLTNECLLSSYLAENGESKEERLAGIANMLDTFTSNFFLAIREGKLEQDMYNHVNEGGSITKDYLNKLTQEYLEKYDGDTIEMDEYRPLKWVMRSHYFSEFYLYDYAICIGVAAYTASKILGGDKEMLDKYIRFLSCGTDKWPDEMFKILGVDLEDEEVYNSAIKYFDSMILRFETLSKED